MSGAQTKCAPSLPILIFLPQDICFLHCHIKSVYLCKVVENVLTSFWPPVLFILDWIIYWSTLLFNCFISSYFLFFSFFLSSYFLNDVVSFLQAPLPPFSHTVYHLVENLGGRQHILLEPGWLLTKNDWSWDSQTADGKWLVFYCLM